MFYHHLKLIGFYVVLLSLLHDKKEEETPATIRGRQLHEYAYLKLTNQDYEEFAEIHQFNDYEENLINCYVNAVHERSY